MGKVILYRARDARQQSQENRDANLDQWRRTINENITAAVREGQFSINMGCVIPTPIVTELRENGFRVDINNCQRDPDTSIFWE